MSQTLRADAWSASDDIILAEAVLSHIKNGSTQLNAFDEVGERLGRTSAACGFRWNSTVRKQYEDSIKEAKTIRKSKGRNIKVAAVASHAGTKHSAIQVSDIDTAIKALEQIKVLLDHKDSQILALKKELSDNKQIDVSMNEDYKTLLDIFNRARDLGAISG